MVGRWPSAQSVVVLKKDGPDSLRGDVLREKKDWYLPDSLTSQVDNGR